MLKNILIGTTAALTNTAASGAPFAPPADGQYQLTPIGEFPVPTTLAALPLDARRALQNSADQVGKLTVVQVVDAAAVAALANSARDVTLIDYEHNSLKPDGSTAAAGWVGKPIAREDGLYGPVQWTNEAEITTGRYRYLSPVFAAGKDLQWLGGNRFRVTSLIGLAVTNTPNITTIKPLSNQDTPDEENKTDTHHTHMKERLIALFGLPADASDDAILAAVEACKKEKDAVATEVLENRKAEAVALCSKHGITDAAKAGEFQKLYLANRESAKALLGFLPASTSTAEAPPAALTNRHPAKTPSSTLGAETQTGQHAFLNEAQQYAKTEKCSLADAIGILAYEKPALYRSYHAALGKEANE